MKVICEHWDAEGALAVLEDLDRHDLAEAGVNMGRCLRPLEALTAFQFGAGAGHDVRVAWAMRADAPMEPFAILSVIRADTAGVAGAGLIARDHRKWRRALAALAVQIRDRLPGYMAERGLTRIEARSWVRHPTGGHLLVAMGFHHEVLMRGFGPKGAEAFHLFSRIEPNRRSDPCA
jgi:hypothetical protein